MIIAIIVITAINKIFGQKFLKLNLLGNLEEELMDVYKNFSKLINIFPLRKYNDQNDLELIKYMYI